MNDLNEKRNNRLNDLLESLNGYNTTCSIHKVRNGCVTFMRNSHYEIFLRGLNIDMVVIADYDPYGLEDIKKYKVKFLISDFPEYDFALYHNYLNNTYEDSHYLSIGNNVEFHNSSVLGKSGLKVIIGPDYDLLNIKHVGNLVIKDNVSIGANSVIHRGVLDDSFIYEDVIIGDLVNIGHNCHIGKGTIIVNGTVLCGSVRIGSNCRIGAGVIINNGISICDNVIIGSGSLITKDIVESGIYRGSPARFCGEYDRGWNF